MRPAAPGDIPDEPAAERVLKASFPALSGEERTAILPPAINHSADPNGDASPPSASPASPSPAASRSSRAGEGASPVCQRPGCGRDIPRQPYARKSEWLARRFCSAECGHLARHVVHEARFCICCKAQLVQRPGEANASFRGRKTCSRECYRELCARNSAGRVLNQHSDVIRYPTVEEQTAFHKGLRFTDDPRAIRDMGSAGHGYRNTLNHSAYGCAAAMCAAGGSKSALRF
jgi:hypothetical protein